MEKDGKRLCLTTPDISVRPATACGKCRTKKKRRYRELGRFFNEKIRNMPTEQVRKLKSKTKVTINPIYGQTKGYLEELRKTYNEPPPLYVSDKDKAKQDA